jgi:hypothetical protein
VVTQVVLAFSMEARRGRSPPQSLSILRHEVDLADVPVRDAADSQRAPGSKRSRHTLATNATLDPVAMTAGTRYRGELARRYARARNSQASQTRRTVTLSRREAISTSRSATRCNTWFRAARLVAWNTPASVLFGVAPHADATSRNPTLRDATTPRDATTLRLLDPRRGPSPATNAEALVPLAADEASPRRKSIGRAPGKRGLRIRSCTRYSATLTSSPCVPRTS